MSQNEGVVRRDHFGGEVAHTNDHPAILFGGMKGDVELVPGMLLEKDENGELIPYTGTGNIAGVNDGPRDADDTTCIYLVHGTCKKRMLARADGSAATETDIAALLAMGIYPL